MRDSLTCEAYYASNVLAPNICNLSMTNAGRKITKKKTSCIEMLSLKRERGPWGEGQSYTESALWKSSKSVFSWRDKDGWGSVIT